MRWFCYWVVFLFLSQTVAASKMEGSFFQQNQFELLRGQLTLYHNIAESSQWAMLPERTCLQPGDTGELVGLLRQNLLLTGDLTQPDTAVSLLFDEALRDGVRRFQARHGLLADGIVGQQTLEALSVSPASRMQQIMLNMERWQQFNKEQAQPTVFVNIPDFTLQLLDKEYRVIWKTRVVVGLPGKNYQTKPMTDQITYLVFNPTWTVPQSIIRNEIIPIMQKDPSYLARNHMQLYRASGKQRALIAATTVNWLTADPVKDNLIIVQEAGPWNALGKLKFMFPNPYAIYLHDTPSKVLFGQLHRAYSHGCVRVQHPEKLAALLLSSDWSKPQDLRPYLGAGTPEKVVRLPAPVRVSLSYFTCWVDAGGILQFRKDIYKLDTATPNLNYYTFF